MEISKLNFTIYKVSGNVGTFDKKINKNILALTGVVNLNFETLGAAQQLHPAANLTIRMYGIYTLQSQFHILFIFSPLHTYRYT